MKYEKPEVVLLGSALEVTRAGSCDKKTDYPDCSTGSSGTPTAYEADE
jgi:hypothetical protein